MKTSSIAIAAALVLGMSTSAFALDGFDADNNPVPGVSGASAAQRSALPRAGAPAGLERAFAASVVDGAAAERDADGNPIPGGR